MSNEEIKIIKLSNGDDIVCVLAKDGKLPDESPLLRLERPMQIRYIPQMTGGGFRDYVALIKWASYTNDKIITIPKSKILTITNAANEMQKSYNEVKSSYDEPNKSIPGYDRKRFTDEENKRLNEIFGDYYDDDEDPGTVH